MKLAKENLQVYPVHNRTEQSIRYSYEYEGTRYDVEEPYSFNRERTRFF